MAKASRTGQVNYVQRGKRGRVPKMMGVYGPQVHYVCTDDVAPVVMFATTDAATGRVDYDYYIMVRNYDWVGTAEGTTPPRDAATGAANASRVWDVFDDLQYVFADLMMVKYGLMAGAVCAEERKDDGSFVYAKMFSQTGADGSTAYEKFDPSKDADDASQKWKPVMCIDWKTGKMWGNAVNLKDAYVSGEIVATKGQIGKFSIDSEGLYAGSGDNTVRITPTSFILKKGLSYGNSPISKTQIGLGDGAYELGGRDNSSAMTGVYIYRRGLAGLWNDNSVELYAPALRVVSDNVLNRDIAIRAEGGSIVAGQGIMSFINAYNGNEYTVLPIDKGGDHMIYNTTYRVIYLPTRKMLNVALGRTTIGTAAVRLCVVNHPMSTADFVLRFQSGDPGTIYDHNGKALGELRMAKGDCFEFYLVCEPNLYWAQEINSTVGI